MSQTTHAGSASTAAIHPARHSHIPNAATRGAAATPTATPHAMLTASRTNGRTAGIYAPSARGRIP